MVNPDIGFKICARGLSISVKLKDSHRWDPSYIIDSVREIDPTRRVVLYNQSLVPSNYLHA